jgi:Na+/H+ antiporter NhaD/arsenite permease-like protein
MSQIEILLTVIFIAGYLGIIFEKQIGIHKAASALSCGVFSWFAIFFFDSGQTPQTVVDLYEYLSEVSQLLFFLMGAMLIVETIDAHKGFEMIGNFLPRNSNLYLYGVILILSFFVSSVLDNLTTLIVFVCLLRRIIPLKDQRAYFLAPVVVSVNAGGAWTPIGDVTTTMLWIEQKISSLGVMEALFIPSIAFLAIFGLIYYSAIPKEIQVKKHEKFETIPTGSRRVLALGILSLLLVPVWKAVFHIPPFLGVLFGVSIIWLLTDYLHEMHEDRHHMRVYHALGRIDTSAIFFFFGILLAVDALQNIGLLPHLAQMLFEWGESVLTVGVLLGFISSVLDNVPLVAACIKMFSAETYPLDHHLWNLVAFCAGVGGSLLLIGSAPGVALMSMEGMSFGWYFRKVTLPCLIAYLITVYLII